MTTRCSVDKAQQVLQVLLKAGVACSADCAHGACSMAWRRIVLDEAQHIRSHNTQVAKACSLLQVCPTTMQA